MDFIDDILTRTQVNPIRDEWNMACLSAGIAAISTHTCAKIMAVLYVHGNNEYMTHHTTFLADVRYIQKRFHLHGAGTPNADFVELVQQYVDELERYENCHKDERCSGGLYSSHIPDWAIELFKSRYDIKLIN